MFKKVLLSLSLAAITHVPLAAMAAGETTDATATAVTAPKAVTPAPDTTPKADAPKPAPVKPVEAPVATKVDTAAPVAPAATGSDVKKEAPKKASGWKIKVGGFVRGDVSYNSGAVFNLDSPLFAYADDSKPAMDKGLAFTARLTRISFETLAPEWHGWQARGYVETDFFGSMPNSNTNIRQAQLRMRLAYAELKKSFTTIRFGNDWMVAAPQFSSCLEPFNMYGQGNLWMRLPQLSVRNRIPIGEKKRLRAEVDVAVGHNMGNDGKEDTNADQLLLAGMGENSGMPLVQARLGVGFKIGDADWSSVGFSYSWQQLKISGSTGSVDGTTLSVFEGTDMDEQTSSFFAVDTQINLKIKKIKVKLTGEFYQGQATGAYWGAILNGVQVTAVPALSVVLPESRGFFGDVKVVLPMRLSLFGGFGQDTITNDDEYGGNSTRVGNSFAYGGLSYALGDGKKPIAVMGLSYANLKTEYKGGKEGSSHIVHAMLMIPF